ncbi:MAG: 3-dehydroquinate synthase [Bacteroidetes bacterium]|nr:3-dehydroquinate synthase [Bacteroidota bacterium]
MGNNVIHVPLGNSSYSIAFTGLADLPSRCASAHLRIGPCIVVTDPNVASIYLDQLRATLISSGYAPITEIIIPSGEASKDAEFLQLIYDRALTSRIDRQTPIFALGGGVIGDLAGYAAATLLRGLPLVHIPTSLIAQVDSSIGGKTGINHSLGKNLIGAFHQPTLVVTDIEMLQSLPDLEYVSGLAEIVKHALIADADFVIDLSANWEKIILRDRKYLDHMIMVAAKIKADIVSQDEREASLRAILNFGHTFAHAIEREAGYGKFTHGEAVALGMRAAAKVSYLVNPNLPYTDINHLLNRLPIRNSIHHLDPMTLTQAMYFDKKVDDGKLRLILLREIGSAYVSTEISEEQIIIGWKSIMSP